jgi:type II secretory ATPase GspE/PulE/Tfp pilus assembly ATPase PilB-like protein
MSGGLADRWRDRFAACAPRDDDFVPRVVDALLAFAEEAGATDVHLLPDETGLDFRLRIDGVLQRVARLDLDIAPRVVARLKVLANLLTYRTDVPQEGRLRKGTERREIRLSTFPCLFGEKAVVRLFVGSGGFRHLDELGLPEDASTRLRSLLTETAGVVLLTGPAGSGKSTTIYACLREIADKTDGGRNLVSLEDPIEVVVPGVTQSQIAPAAGAGQGFSLATGLKALLRQDPDVIMVGEIRDRETAETVFQASLTGHLVLTTFHAGSAAQAVGRLSDMGIEPYLLRSSLLGILCQRLLRRVCTCATPVTDETLCRPWSAPVVKRANGCPTCRGTGYSGRLLAGELFEPSRDEVARGILTRMDAAKLERLAVEQGMIPQRERVRREVAAGRTTPEEALRVLGSRALEG